MACSNSHLEIDNDSTFGDDDFFWISNPMFSTPTVAGTKRGAQNLEDDARTRGSGSDRLEHLPGAEDTDQDAPCCCPETCSEADGIRPSKRRASALQVGDFHSTDADCQFPDDCFEKFCQECNLDASCLPDCAVPCPADAECTTPDACWDPHCSPLEAECADGCVDPECTKLSRPEQTCFCHDCGVQPCPLGDPDSECHCAHTAPTTTGAIYCYDNAPCHFQERIHGHGAGLSSYETYPCFSQTHDYTHGDDVTTQASSAPTPALSHSNYTSLESAFTFEPSPVSGQKSFSDCFLDVTGDHCHMDNSCCHGPDRACGDFPSASKQQLDVWNLSTARGNGLSNNFMSFGLSSSPTSPTSASSNAFSNNIYSPMIGFKDTSWMLMDPTLSASFSPDMLGFNKLDYLASAVQQDILKPTSAIRETTALDGSNLAGSSETEQCICRWQHAPGNLCLATFPTPFALHAHIKSSHVDSCTFCFCLWSGCDASTKDFKQRSKLSRHLLGHAGHRPYPCTFPGCPKTFATNQAKDNHERTHTGERPYVCDRCGYTTTTHTQLQTHISALHEGRKPHKCRFCDFTCADSSNLSKHERTHQTLRPYRCPHPGCTFKPDCRWENLKRHLRRSGHCAQLLEEASEEYKDYRDGVRKEIEEWHRREGDGGAAKGRRKGRGSI